MAVGPVWNYLNGPSRYGTQKWVRYGMPDFFKRIALDDVAALRKAWEESKEFHNLEKKLPELCVWGMDGRRVADEKTEHQDSRAT
jgi:hypothetical protein